MRRRVLVLLAAFVLAVISGSAVLGYAHSADERAVRGMQAKWVLLAGDVIPAGTSYADIRARNLVRQVRMPAATVPEGALTRLDSAMDELRLTAALQPDQLLLSGQFAEATDMTTPAPTFAIPRGRLAVSVGLAVSTQVAGNVDAGDEVTVFATYPRQDAGAADQKTTFVLLPRVRVISVGERPATPSTSATPDPSASPSASAATGAGTAEALERYLVTLSVTPREATLLINSSHTSDLQLALIGPGTKVTAAPKLSLPPSQSPPTTPGGADA